MRLAITVTEGHLANGIRASSNRCPIALAMREALEPDFLCVTDNFASIGPNARGLPAPMPQRELF